MVRQSAAAVLALGLGLARDPGCSGVDDPQGGTNAPCTRNADCKTDLRCSEGVCVDPTIDPDAATLAPDSGAADATDDG